MRLPKFLNPFVTKEALVGWALALHQNVWWLIQVGGDVDFIATYSPKLLELFQDGLGAWVVALFGVALIAHSYYRSTRYKEQQDVTGTKPEHSSADAAPLDMPDLTRRVPEALERLLYLGQVIFSCERTHEHLLGVDMYCFNGSAEEIDIMYVRGHIRADETCDGKKIVEFGILETPQIHGDRTSLHINPLSEFRISLWQPIPAAMADVCGTGNKEEIKLAFDFEDLDIQLRCSTDHSATVRMPLWGGAIFSKLANHYCTHRSVRVRPLPVGAG